jgi:hypothetical protein
MNTISKQNIGITRLKLLLGPDSVKNICYVILQGLKTTPLMIISQDTFGFDVSIHLPFRHASSKDMRYLSSLINTELKSVLKLNGISSLDVTCKKPVMWYLSLAWVYNFFIQRILKKPVLYHLHVTFQWQEQVSLITIHQPIQGWRNRSSTLGRL